MKKKADRKGEKKDAFSQAFHHFDAKMEEIEADEREASERIIFDGVRDLRKEFKGEIAGSMHFLAALQFIEREKETFIPTATEKPRFRGKEEFYQQLSQDLLRFAEISPIRLWGFERLCETFLEFHPLKGMECDDVKECLKVLIDEQAIPQPVLLNDTTTYVISSGGLTDLQNKLMRQIAGSGGQTDVPDIALLTGMSNEEVLVAIDDLVEKGILILTKDSEIYMPSVFA